MKTLLALTFTLLLVVSGASAQDRYPKPKKTNDPAVWLVTKQGFTDPTKVTVSYHPLAAITEGVRKDGALKMAPEAETAQKVEQATTSFPGGYLIVNVSTTQGLATGNNANFLAIVQRPDGSELVRYQPAADVPDLNFYSGVGVYSNVFIVALPEPPSTDTHLFVVDALNQRRHEFLLRP